MRARKIVLMFAVIAVLLIIILGRPITTDAPQIMGSKEIEDALNAASELDEQNVVRVDIPDGNGGYQRNRLNEWRLFYIAIKSGQLFCSCPPGDIEYIICPETRKPSYRIYSICRSLVFMPIFS